MNSRATAAAMRAIPRFAMIASGYLSRVLVQIAIVIGRSKREHDLATFFHKKLPRGYKKAAVATARRLLVRIHRLLTNDVAYSPPPPAPLTEHQRKRRALTSRASKRLATPSSSSRSPHDQTQTVLQALT